MGEDIENLTTEILKSSSSTSTIIREEVSANHNLLINTTMYSQYRQTCNKALPFERKSAKYDSNRDFFLVTSAWKLKVASSSLAASYGQM